PHASIRCRCCATNDSDPSLKRGSRRPRVPGYPSRPRGIRESCAHRVPADRVGSGRDLASSTIGRAPNTVHAQSGEKMPGKWRAIAAFTLLVPFVTGSASGAEKKVEVTPFIGYRVGGDLPYVEGASRATIPE